MTDGCEIGAINADLKDIASRGDDRYMQIQISQVYHDEDDENDENDENSATRLEAMRVLAEDQRKREE